MKTSTSVLIVDDDKWLLEQFVRVLSKAGYEVTVAQHALVAIKIIDDINPDAIILDVLLTGNTAFTLLHELQSYGDTGAIPIILCTNLASELSLNDLKSYGVVRILDKAKMAPNDLVATLRSILQ